MKIRTIFLKHKLRFILIISLVVLESIIELLFPLFIGFAIDGALRQEYVGAFGLGGLGLAIVLIGGSRRFYDSRFYATLYRTLGNDALSKLTKNTSSVKTARLGMIGEIIEFLENSFPAMISSIIGIFGVVAIIANLNFKVFIIGVIATLLVFTIYYLTRKKTTFFNSCYNNELEKQVNVISTNDKVSLDSHIGKTMKWNIKLSDLEVFNFSASWLVMIGFLVTSIVVSVHEDTSLQYGALFALIMYVFQYIESVITLPLFYQNWLRLEEIKKRLENL